jgi:hypothetical protein
MRDGTWPLISLRIENFQLVTKREISGNLFGRIIESLGQNIQFGKSSELYRNRSRPLVSVRGDKRQIDRISGDGTSKLIAREGRNLKIRELCQVPRNRLVEDVPMQVQDLQHLQSENGWRNATGEKILREIRVLQVHNLGAKCGWNGTGERVSTRWNFK